LAGFKPFGRSSTKQMFSHPSRKTNRKEVVTCMNKLLQIIEECLGKYK